MYSLSHFLAIGVIFLIGLIVHSQRKFFQESPKVARVIIVSLACLAYLIDFIAHYYLLGDFDLNYNLMPLFVCGASVIIIAISSLFKSPLLFKLAFFWGIISVMVSFSMPGEEQVFPHPDYLLFWMWHSILFITLAILLVSNEVRIRYRDLWISYLILFGYSVVVYQINDFMGANYMFLNAAPSNLQAIYDSLNIEQVGGYGLFIPYGVLSLLVFHLIYLIYIWFRTVRRLN